MLLWRAWHVESHWAFSIIAFASLMNSWVFFVRVVFKTEVRWIKLQGRVNACTPYWKTCFPNSFIAEANHYSTPPHYIHMCIFIYLNPWLSNYVALNTLVKMSRPSLHAPFLNALSYGKHSDSTVGRSLIVNTPNRLEKCRLNLRFLV
jgi:hypothetical protein